MPIKGNWKKPHMVFAYYLQTLIAMTLISPQEDLKATALKIKTTTVLSQARLRLNKTKLT